jgi:hypothetical protein
MSGADATFRPLYVEVDVDAVRDESLAFARWLSDLMNKHYGHYWPSMFMRGLPTRVRTPWGTVPIMYPLSMPEPV